MEEGHIRILWLNDFIFCPVSIYFRQLYGDRDRMIYQSSYQLNGTAAHEAVDNRKYSTRSTVLQSIPVYSEEYGLSGKIDIYDTTTGILIERKKKLKNIYDGQIYGQYHCLTEMGYNIKSLRIYSMDDNKTHTIPLPSEDKNLNRRFKHLINDIRTFDMNGYLPDNPAKCTNCIYEPSCDRSIKEAENA